MRNGNSIIDLVKDITQQTRTLLREEAQLIKVELTEKAVCLGKNAVGVAIGGFVAYAGLIIFLGALGILVAWGLEQLGWAPALAEFAGLGIIAILVIATGAVLIMKGIRAFKTSSFAPKRTIETWQHLKGEEAGRKHLPEPKPKERTSAEIEASVLATEQEMAETLEEIGDRVSLRHLREQATTEVRAHPYRWGLVAMGAGLAGSLFVKRKRG